MIRLKSFKSVAVNVGILAALFTLLFVLPGCAKNVDHADFTKWGNSFIPRGTSVDTSAQGGAVQGNLTPQNANNKMPKASVGGAYHRSFATSPSYRMVGGFHVTAGQ